MTTAPFTAGVATLITATHAVAAAVTVTTAGYPDTTMNVTSGSLTWAENQSPRVSGSITCSLPEDATVLDTILDPRRPVRVVVKVTYTLPSGSPDTQTVANLGLRSRSVNRPSTEVTLRVQSDEAMAIDASPGFLADGGSAGDPDTITLADGPAYIRNNITALTYPWVPTFVTNCPVDTVEVPYRGTTDTWDTLMDAADQLDIDVYDNGDRVFRLAPRPTVASTSVLALKTGPGGTLLDTDATTTRDNWANMVLINFEWNNSVGVTQDTYGIAKVNSGPYKVDTIPNRVYTESRGTATTTAAANKIAATILRKKLSGARTYQLRAIAAWWLRPGHTVTVTLPTSGQQRHIVSDVTYDLSDMSMAVTTRLPDSASTIGE